MASDMRETTWSFDTLTIVDDCQTELEESIKLQKPNIVNETAASSALEEDHAMDKHLGTLRALPRELRDMIYEYAVVHDIPIEFAPLEVHGTRNEYRSRMINGRIEVRRHWGYMYCPRQYHARRFHTKITPSLALLRVSKQVSEEVAKVFYGENKFWFSGRVGWPILGEWLFGLRPEIRNMIRHITVGHPDLCELSNNWETARRDAEEANNVPPRDPRRKQFYFLPWCPNTPRRAQSYNAPWCGGMALSSTYLANVNLRVNKADYQERLREIDPTKLLSTMTELKTFDFTLFACYDPVDFVSLLQHPINSFDWSAHKNLQRRIINLFDNFNGRQVEFSLGMLDGPRNYTDIIDAPSGLPSSNIEHARRFFDVMAEKGWEVKEMLYDNHFSFPVPKLMSCNDDRICRSQFRRFFHAGGRFFCCEWGDCHRKYGVILQKQKAGDNAKQAAALSRTKSQAKQNARCAAIQARARLVEKGFADILPDCLISSHGHGKEGEVFCRLKLDHGGQCEFDEVLYGQANDGS